MNRVIMINHRGKIRRSLHYYIDAIINKLTKDYQKSFNKTISETVNENCIINK